MNIMLINEQSTAKDSDEKPRSLPLVVVNKEVKLFVEWRKAVRSFIGFICISGGGPYVDRNKNGEAVARKYCNGFSGAAL